MRDILAALRLDLLANIDYIGGCEIIEDASLPPASMAFPFIGLKDGDLSHRSAPGQMDDDVGTISIYLYQSISGPDQGASIMGLGNDKGILELAEDVRLRVNDNLLGQIIQFLHLDQEFASEPGLIDDNIFVQRKRLTARFERTTR